MEVIAEAKSVRISPRKVRLVADSIRKMSVANAVATLQLVHKHGAYVLSKTLNSAIANAVNNSKLSQKDLIIKEIAVEEGAFLKRYHASTRGRIHPYKKRATHVTVVLKEVTK